MKAITIKSKEKGKIRTRTCLIVAPKKKTILQWFECVSSKTHMLLM
jgi:hypothetical protein